MRALERSGRAKALTLLEASGVSPWLAHLSDDIVRDGRLSDLIAQGGLRGAAVDPDVGDTALGPASLERLRGRVPRDQRAGGAAALLVANTARRACDQFAGTFHRSHGADGRVCAPIDPRPADDPTTILHRARRMWVTVGRANLLVELPGTAGGRRTVQRLTAEGLGTSITVVTAEQSRQVAAAYVAGMKEARDNGRNLANTACVIRVVLAPVDSEVDRRLARSGHSSGEQSWGSAALSSARDAHSAMTRCLDSALWHDLAAHSARPPRLAWSDYGTAQHLDYIHELITPGAICLLTLPTLEDLTWHGTPPSGDLVTDSYQHAREHLTVLTSLGIDLDDVGEIVGHRLLQDRALAWNRLSQSLQRLLGGKDLYL